MNKYIWNENQQRSIIDDLKPYLLGEGHLTKKEIGVDGGERLNSHIHTLIDQGDAKVSVDGHRIPIPYKLDTINRMGNLIDIFCGYSFSPFICEFAHSKIEKANKSQTWQ